jgi:hypothetical protein
VCHGGGKFQVGDGKRNRDDSAAVTKEERMEAGNGVRQTMGGALAVVGVKPDASHA